ncbi:MAG: hypothetical protein NT120_02160 [Candidatus Aenigmarchaeota archaeon]|nr:hypothetical protein [Candidatus Aenigmarchaeota archaeon]
MIDICVQVWGSLDFSSYEWVTVGKIRKPKSLDIDYLSKRAIRLFKQIENIPQTDAVRLQVLIDGRKEMTMTVLDFFKNYLQKLN